MRESCITYLNTTVTDDWIKMKRKTLAGVITSFVVFHVLCFGW